jgi:hypothetical protein
MSRDDFFREREKRKPVLDRDEHNQIKDKDQADRILDGLMQKARTEQRAVDRENTMHVARTGKRDIIVHLAVTVLPQINGINIAGEREKEFGQWCFRLNARMLPARKGMAHKAFAELAHVGMQALMKMGLITV